ncbi:unnamed protein product [Auanema sp. JU1783]|nr:unnamed protein product [Auanema sp. JU1783]
MTIPTADVLNHYQKEKPEAADSVEITPAKSISGKVVRRSVYSIYIILMAASGIILYLQPCETTLLIFLILHSLMILSFYFLVRLVLCSQNANLIVTLSGLRWEQHEANQSPLEFPAKIQQSHGIIGRDHLSYAFI